MILFIHLEQQQKCMYSTCLGMLRKYKYIYLTNSYTDKIKILVEHEQWEGNIEETARWKIK